MRMIRSLLISGSAAALAGGLALTGGATATVAGTVAGGTVAGGTVAGGTVAARPAAAGRMASHLAIRRPPVRFLREAKAALVKYLQDNHPTIMLTQPGPLPRSTASVDSYNWSGYADSATTPLPAFSHVSGSWVMPAVTCTAEDTITSQWVGLDGANSSTVEQDGTIGWCFEGVPTYFTWYEMYPAGAVEVGTSLAPGDAISASVTRTGPTSYSLAVTDATHPSSSFTQTASCAVKCTNSSAEWISERPSFAIGIVPLANYGSWTLTNAQETFQGTTGNISSYPNSYQINMQDATQNYLLATTSALGGGGSSFTTTWQNSY
jgi:Peptidase A4 family